MPDNAAWEAFARDAGLLLLSWLLGGVIGWQREAEQRAAGLRTHMLVCGGSCLLSLVSFGGTGDPGRIAAQVVTGIGFLGAGVILRRGLSVRGLTTAATIWVVAGVGIAVGAGGRYAAALAVLATGFSLLTLTVVRRLESAIIRQKGDLTLVTNLPRYKGTVLRLMEALTEAGAVVTGIEAEATDDAEQRLVRVHMNVPQDLNVGLLTGVLADKLPDIRIEWEE